MYKNIKIADLFGGVGGFRKGAEKYFSKKNKKVECVLYAEKDKFARKTYFSNFGDNHFFVDDIREIIDSSEINIPKYDILFAGFPCQPFSIMGSEKGFKDRRGELFFYLEKIIKKTTPDYFILENVARIETIDNKKTFKTIIEILKNKLNYNLFVYKLNSFDFGVSQVRRRIYFCGIKKELNEKQIKRLSFNPVYKGKKRKNFLEKNVDEKYFLSEKIKKTILSDGNHKWKAKSEINKIPARPLVKTMHKMHRASQDNYYSLDFIKKIHGKSNEIEKKDNNKIRRLTPKEAFRLQGFEDEFVENAIKAGISNTQLYMQAGNAVTVNVVESVLEHIFETVNQN